MTIPRTPHDHFVLGGIRAIDETIAAEPVPDGRWTWHHLAVLGAVAFVLGVVVWNVAGGVA
jgi:hypothetical protein